MHYSDAEAHEEEHSRGKVAVTNCATQTRQALVANVLQLPKQKRDV